MFTRSGLARVRALRVQAHACSLGRTIATHRLDILSCDGTSFFKFGEPTSESDNALFRDLTWRIRDEGSSSRSQPTPPRGSNGSTPIPETHNDRAEAWALIGPRAALLADAALMGRARADPVASRRWPFLGTSRPIDEAVKKVAFNTRLESNNVGSQPGEFVDYTARYYSVRSDDEDAVTLRQHLTKYLPEDVKRAGERETSEELKKVSMPLKLDHLLDIPLVALSNGQTRRARIARALLTRPEVLVLEEPFSEYVVCERAVDYKPLSLRRSVCRSLTAGLDVASRTLIADLLGRLHAARAPRIVLILRPQDTVPEWVSNVVETSHTAPQRPLYIGQKSGWTPSQRLECHSRPQTRRIVADSTASEIFRVDKANIGYQDRKVLKEISWTLRAGDRVALTGANGEDVGKDRATTRSVHHTRLMAYTRFASHSTGSGKSTLLSLILGDHPASYSQNLTLFSQPRDKHSVYSLSQKTGHFSPELYAAFPRRFGDAGLSLYEAIGTGFENVFTYRKLTDPQKQRIDALLDRFDSKQEIFTRRLLHDTLFAEADAPLQALTLIMRAAVKTPELLILDEPFAGMSNHLIQKCRTFLDNDLEPRQTMIFISHYQEEWPDSLGKQMHLEDGHGTEKLL